MRNMAFNFLFRKFIGDLKKTEKEFVEGRNYLPLTEKTKKIKKKNYNDAI